MKTISTLAILSFVGLLPLTTTAQSLDNGLESLLLQGRTQVQVSYGTGVGTFIEQAGDVDVPSVSLSAAAPAGGGSAEASSTMNNGGYVPTLRTEATASNTRHQAVAWGVQAYQNISGAPQTTSLQLSLTGNITGGNELQAEVFMFQTDTFDFNPDPGTMKFESSSEFWPGFEPLASPFDPNSFDLEINTDGPVDINRSFEFTVQPGEAFYVWARLVSSADNPGTADASSTLTASLSDTTGLVPVLVPEPGVIAFLVAGGAALFLHQRRRRRK